MPATIDLLETNVFQALRVNFLLPIIPAGVEVVRGLVNKVPPPPGTDYVVLTPLLRARLGTNVETWDPTAPTPTAINVASSFETRVQIDVHGPNSADTATVIATLWRSQYACDQFTASGFAIQPLYCEEPRQTAFEDEAQQVEERWLIDAAMQINPNILLSQDFANTLTIGLINVDASYPP